MKKILGLSTLALAGVLAFTGCSCNKDEGNKLDPLPAARLTEDGCTSDNYKNACAAINKDNLYNYLGREDVVYIDLRESNTNETESGYSESNYMGMHLKGFKNIEFVSYIQGNKNQLFYVAPDKSLGPSYTTALEILEELFPKDKAIFLMCDSGNKARSVMKLLAQYGWDMSKVYNVGAIANYGNSNYLLISTGAQKNDDI
jgi:rhodanese-related sulfurtransferase